MDTLHEDCFVVFLRSQHGFNDAPDTAEQELAVCDSYEEARTVRQRCHNSGLGCVIRYVGDVGGGD